MKKVLLVTDKSGGHILPALTLVPFLNNDYKVYFFTTSPFFKDKLDKEKVPVIGRTLASPAMPLEMVYRFGEAVYIILRYRPEKIIGFGGRASFWLMILGSLLFQDTGIYEPNVRFGRANAFLKNLVKRVYTGFNTQGGSKKIRKVGVPLHRGIKNLPKEEARKILGLDTAEPVVFCFGGSQGSSFINTLFMRLVEETREGFQVIHLTGKRDYYYFLKFYDKIKEKRCFVKDFSPDIGVLYSAADVVISRAGAITLAEISYFKLPSIIIPYPGASGHQRVNAEFFKKKKAAYVLFQEEVNYDNFKFAVLNLLRNQQLQKEIVDNLERINLWTGGEDFFKGIFFDNDNS